MCHLVLLMPLFGLGLFLVLPWPVAVPVYVLILLVSALLYFKTIQAMKQPVQVGREALLGKTVEVVTVVDGPSLARYLVRDGGELWSASSPCEFKPGDKATVKGLEGSRMVLEPISGESARSPVAETSCH